MLLLSAQPFARCSPYTRKTKSLQRKPSIMSASPFCKGGLLQTKSLVTSESSKGLQRAGVGSHFLAQERGVLAFVTGLAQGAHRFLRRRLGCACKSPSPTQPWLAFPPNPPQASKFSVLKHEGLAGILWKQAHALSGSRASQKTGKGWPLGVMLSGSHAW